MGKLPYFPFYPDDYLSSTKVMGMTFAQRGIYFHLLCYSWKYPNCRLPNDMEILQRYCAGAKSRDIKKVLDLCFIVDPTDGSWTFNGRMADEWRIANQKHLKASETAKLREELKRQSRNVPEMCPPRGHNQNQNQNQIKEESKEGGKGKRFSPPTLEEVTVYCKERSNGVDPIKFYNFYEAKDWMIGKNKMKKWKNAIITWEKKHDESKDWL